MRKPSVRTWSIASGLLLSTASPGCAPRPSAELPPAPAVVAVPVAPPAPPAELTRCADRPEGLPEDPALVAQIPTRLRGGIIRMARAFGANAAQLDRLIEWVSAGACPAPTKEK